MPALQRRRRCVGNQCFNAPEGIVYVDAENLHTWKTARIGQVRENGQFAILWTSERAIRPLPYPPFRLKRRFVAHYNASAGYEDAYFISLQGRVVFSAGRHEDLGVDLRAPPFRDTELARVIKRVLMLMSTDVSDFFRYGPAGKPVAFIATPLFQHPRLVGVAAFRLSSDEVYRAVNDYTGLDAPARRFSPPGGEMTPSSSRRLGMTRTPHFNAQSRSAAAWAGRSRRPSRPAKARASPWTTRAGRSWR
jgi:Periplasmic binding protein domain